MAKARRTKSRVDKRSWQGQGHRKWQVLAALAGIAILAMGGFWLYRNGLASRWMDAATALVKPDEPAQGKPAATPSQPKPDPVRVKVFFGNSEMETDGCSEVFAVTRQLPAGETLLRSAVSALLQGPTEQESSEGYYTSLNSGVRCLGLSVKEGTVWVDFDQTLEVNLAGSCQVEAVRAQIQKTLTQFRTAKSVRITVEGREWTVLQP